MRIREVGIAGYRSLRAIRFPVGGLTVFVGANGVGKTNLYRALQLLQASAAGDAVARARVRRRHAVRAVGRQTADEPACAHEIVGRARRRRSRPTAGGVQLQRRHRRHLFLCDRHRLADADRRCASVGASGQGGDAAVSQGPAAAHHPRSPRPARRRHRRGGQEASAGYRPARLRDRARRDPGSGALS